MLNTVNVVSCKSCSKCIHDGKTGCGFGRDIYSKGYEGMTNDDCIMNDKKFFKAKEETTIRISPFSNRVIRHSGRSRRKVVVA